jgi:putative tryptophan/tyrosine transport system substrate-binding protein
MRRREFIAGLGSAAAWPLAARAQQRDMRRIGILMGLTESDAESPFNITAFEGELARLGWVDGRNARIVRRWSGADVNLTRIFAKELVELQPDVIVSAGTPATEALQRETRTIPVVFTVIDPVFSGFVTDLSRPGGNLTGFQVGVSEGLAGKHLQMLKEIAPSIRQAAAMYNPENSVGPKYFLGSFEAAAQVSMVVPMIAPVNNDAEIVSTIDSLGREQGGLVVVNDAFTASHHAVAEIISAAIRNKVPMISGGSDITRSGGLLSYGTSVANFSPQAAGYVNRILRGEKPADLPVQLPTKFHLAINLKTAKALGLTIPTDLLVRADEVID